MFLDFRSDDVVRKYEVGVKHSDQGGINIHWDITNDFFCISFSCI